MAKKIAKKLTKEERNITKLKAMEPQVAPLRARIKAALTGQSSNVFAIGAALAEAHELYSQPGCKGLFKFWVEVEFPFNRTTAYKYMTSFRAFGHCKSNLEIPLDSMYRLSSSPEAVTKAISLDKIGKHVGPTRVKQLLVEFPVNGKPKRIPGPKPPVARHETNGAVAREPGDDSEAIADERAKRKASGKPLVSAKRRREAIEALQVIGKFVSDFGLRDVSRRSMETLEGIIKGAGHE